MSKRIGERATAAPARILRLRLTLRDIAPPVRRVLDVPESMTFSRLHRAIQILFGWDDAHLWRFESASGAWGPAEDEWPGAALQTRDPARSSVREAFASPRAKLAYNYDFGDDWWVDIALEAKADAEPGVALPRCVSGTRAGPPEDCGGLPGYADLVDAFRNPDDEDARELLEWVGPDWDPEAFDLDRVNKALAALPRSRRLQ